MCYLHLVMNELTISQSVIRGREIMKAPHTDEVAEYKMMAKDATQHHLFHICPQPRQFLNSELFRKEKALKFL